MVGDSDGEDQSADALPVQWQACAAGLPYATGNGAKLGMDGTEELEICLKTLGRVSNKT